MPLTYADMINTAVYEHILPKKTDCFIRRAFTKDVIEELETNFETGEIHTGWNESGSFIPVNPFEGRVHWVDVCTANHDGQFGSPGSLYPWDWHLPVLCRFGGTMNPVLSLAYMLGYKDVAVIGCDLGFEEPDPDDEIDHNHFHPQYFTKIDGYWKFHNQTLSHVHSIAKMNFERSGRRIVNCGIGGNLEVYDRIDLIDWLES